MLIYRVEMPDGIGPYQSHNGRKEKYLSTFHDAMVKDHCHGSSHPTILDDISFEWRRKNPDWKCGFLSMADLERWFDDFIYLILEAGGAIKTYDVEREKICIGQSGRQVAFVIP